MITFTLSRASLVPQRNGPFDDSSTRHFLGSPVDVVSFDSSGALVAVVAGSQCAVFDYDSIWHRVWQAPPISMPFVVCDSTPSLAPLVTLQRTRPLLSLRWNRFDENQVAIGLRGAGIVELFDLATTAGFDAAPQCTLKSATGVGATDVRFFASPSFHSQPHHDVRSLSALPFPTAHRVGSCDRDGFVRLWDLRDRRGLVSSIDLGHSYGTPVCMLDLDENTFVGGTSLGALCCYDFRRLGSPLGVVATGDFLEPFRRKESMCLSATLAASLNRCASQLGGEDPASTPGPGGTGEAGEVRFPRSAPAAHPDGALPRESPLVLSSRPGPSAPEGGMVAPSTAASSFLFAPGSSAPRTLGPAVAGLQPHPRWGAHCCVQFRDGTCALVDLPGALEWALRGGAAPNPVKSLWAPPLHVHPPGHPYPRLGLGCFSAVTGSYAVPLEMGLAFADLSPLPAPLSSVSSRWGVNLAPPLSPVVRPAASNGSGDDGLALESVAFLDRSLTLPDPGSEAAPPDPPADSGEGGEALGADQQQSGDEDDRAPTTGTPGSQPKARGRDRGLITAYFSPRKATRPPDPPSAEELAAQAAAAASRAVACAAEAREDRLLAQWISLHWYHHGSPSAHRGQAGGWLPLEHPLEATAPTVELTPLGGVAQEMPAMDIDPTPSGAEDDEGGPSLGWNPFYQSRMQGWPTAVGMHPVSDWALVGGSQGELVVMGSGDFRA
ncbi:hypothetical protein PAPYR_4365 [Paratrimastix pyriformis]|uniref:Uncharacterized protein n=1 Tax=Paratrimastix pyriformis TaxID=342808 RepID=A0ABQ8UK82_9EUKA|nr:hypothetical protein PAPYR_4365 [Paratrimastix pyriformis]